ncbi:MAG: hypothetical protein C6Y22_18690 [Hapalosiphonaceae cyanobacterium JJU2]|nr:MAG: hypothetical protein C6Y22_18690 [Hapalosiphonaceae cyanobacterium JJU2]
MLHLFALSDKPEVICINQDVLTYFYAVQRSRLPMNTVPPDRGLSDTNRGEVNQNNSTRKHRNWRFVAHPITHLIKIKSP